MAIKYKLNLSPDALKFNDIQNIKKEQDKFRLRL